MAQHFLLSRAARSLDMRWLFEMTEPEARAFLARLRWPRTSGAPVCPACDHVVCWTIEGGRRYRCSACGRRFSVTSNTVLHGRKRPVRDHLIAVGLAVGAVKGMSALQLARCIGGQYKSLFVLGHKMRETLANTYDDVRLDGSKATEIDGCYVGGVQRKSNFRANQRDRWKARLRSGKMRSVIVLRERGGKVLVGVFLSEGDAERFIRERIPPKAVVHTDEGRDWTRLAAWYEVHQIKHKEAFSANGACTNQAESFFSRLRRAEMGQHHRIAGPYLRNYAREMAWREERRQQGTKEMFLEVLGLMMSSPSSLAFRGYWQRSRRKTSG